MREFVVSCEISASVDDVWAILADVEGWPQWTASISQIALLTPKPFGLKSRVLIQQPRLRKTVWEVTVWDPGHRFQWQSAGLGVRVIADHVLEARHGGTQVNLAVRFNGPLASVIGRLSGHLTRRYVQLEAEGLKRRSELSATPTTDCARDEAALSP
ncbi:MAG TPA: SRPBCC family protein [Steroidobacteraceae bacterium]